MARRSSHPTPEQRIADALKLSGGTMPLAVLFETDAEVRQAKAALKGKRGKRLITVETLAAAEARRRCPLQGPQAAQEPARAADKPTRAPARTGAARPGKTGKRSR
jgi:hypothetical protein